ncbi:transcriptional regulator [Pseudomonas sp. OV226]|uniref:transcriptional regulator n=1 Tax=Pseudomonas sp. OV226 TaxID=2135588 RepID=UPI000D6D6C7E|nr:YdaS family helix-turn-helix protein [Pseudomonas sp. OV226]
MSIEAMACAAEALGSQTNLAKELGCTPQNVQHMCATGHVPAKHVLRIEAASGISRSRLRPDLYPDSPATLEQSLPGKVAPQQSEKPAVNPSSAEVAL